jgi:hypothetical protein
LVGTQRNIQSLFSIYQGHRKKSHGLTYSSLPSSCPAILFTQLLKVITVTGIKLFIRLVDIDQMGLVVNGIVGREPQKPSFQLFMVFLSMG